MGNGTQGEGEVEGRARGIDGGREQEGSRKGQEDHEIGGRDGQQSAGAIREYGEAQK